MRRRNPARLFLCLPLMLVMAVWAFSVGRETEHKFSLGNTNYRIISAHGYLLLRARDSVSFVSHRADIPYWAVWLATALFTFLIYNLLRPRKPHALG